MGKKISENKNSSWDKELHIPIRDAVNFYSTGGRTSFHVPGHKGSMPGMTDLFGEKSVSMDLTELPGTDDLHEPGGPILEAQQMAAALFGADETFFLVNGTTSGIMAAMAACAGSSDTVIAERNTHLSAGRGFVLSGAFPYYVYNHFDRKNCLPSGISAEELRAAIQNCGRPAAVVITHPSYYGTYSDIEEIVRTAHEAGVPVIADEAHGGQLAFTGQEGIPAALEAGADISVQSTHKMLGSLTQSSMLHVQGGLVDRDRLRYFVSFMNSTSPSYLLMASLDAARAAMEADGRHIWKGISDQVRAAKEELSGLDGIAIPETFEGTDGILHPVEGSRILISARQLGIGGPELSRILADDCGIDLEFADPVYAAALAGAGSRPEDFRRLAEAVRDISSRFSGRRAAGPSERMKDMIREYAASFSIRPERVISPREAVFGRVISLDGEKAEGCVSAADISMYPPGVPIVRSGERLTADIIGYIEKAAGLGFSFHGLADRNHEGEGLPGGSAPKFLCTEDENDINMLTGIF